MMMVKILFVYLDLPRKKIIETIISDLGVDCLSGLFQIPLRMDHFYSNLSLLKTWKHSNQEKNKDNYNQ